MLLAEKQGVTLMAVKFSPPSDSIYFDKITTGNANAGNGGNGTNYGNISNNPTLKFDPTNKAYGASVDVNTGDHVHQKAYWDAGGAIAGDPPSGGVNATATSNGSQSSSSGHDTSDVYANTNAYQTNDLWVDQSQQAFAGIGGYGGDGNQAESGSVEVLSMSLPFDSVS
jgi:hypothetical protein